MNTSTRILVWDLPLRLVHWAVALGVLLCWITSRLGPLYFAWHLAAGCAVLVLVTFRIIWGFIGTRHARFSAFVTGPSGVWSYLRGAPSGRNEPLGHNPLGALAILAMLALLLAQSLTGVFVLNDVVNEGPFTELVPTAVANAMTALHDAVLWDLLLAAIALHILAVLGYALVKRHDLTRPMLTGCKWLPEATPRPGMARPALGVLLLASAAGLAALLADKL